MSAWTVVGLLAALCTTGCWVPQALKSVKTGSAADFSWTYLALMVAGVLLWAIYGFVRKDARRARSQRRHLSFSAAGGVREIALAIALSRPCALSFARDRNRVAATDAGDGYCNVPS